MMTGPRSAGRRLAGGQPVPRLAKAGGGVMAAGLLADLAEHTVVPHLHDAVVAGFPLGEHAAHLVVLVGMVLVLVAIVVDGTRTRGRQRRLERSAPDALR